VDPAQTRDPRWPHHTLTRSEGCRLTRVANGIRERDPASDREMASRIDDRAGAWPRQDRDSAVAA